MYRPITRHELEELLAVEAPPVLIDALPQGYYEREHLPGAINLTESEVDRLAPSVLPDLDRTLVTYCANEACPNSKAVARRLVALGYTDVRTYAGGFQDWVEAGNPTQTSLAS